MDLITTHINADFDALSSIVAARKLYPNARLLLPGSQEKAVRDFLSLSKDIIVFETEKECDLKDIDRLILVDTRHKTRIGIAADLVEKGVQVHIYDHHPRMKGDVVADKDVYAQVGATVTILLEFIRKKRIRLSCLEATLMLLGIYEETGSLTYRTTTERDIEIVGYLLSKGANLAVVSSYINRELTEEELSVLTRLINATERIVVKGVSISFIGLKTDTFISEIGMLVHKLMEIENIPVLFLIIKDSLHKTSIIGRSKLSGIDMNKILGHFGGGGHPTAASAKVEDTDNRDIKERIIKLLKSSIRVKSRAKDIMSTKVRSVDINRRIAETRRMLIEEGLSGAPVTERGRLAGVITLEETNKAMKRGFGHSRVKGYMSINPVTVKLDTPLYTIRDIVSRRDIGVIPVLRQGKIVGIVNRSDVLNSIYDGMCAARQITRQRVTANISNKMKAALPPKIMRLLREIGTMANSFNQSAFLVGGVTRDILLGVRNLDLDIVIEGDAIALGKKLADRLDAALVVHKRFGTCTVVTKEKLKIDLATARKEKYERPAALPTVEFSSLKDDLIRRDFTINAMAISLNSGTFGQLVDFFNGREDLENSVIRVMHDESFIDDPTRIFRAVRFEQRLGFRIDAHTEELIQTAVKKEMFEQVEPQRIRDEIILILKEKEPIKALKRMAELHEFRFIHEKIRFDKETLRLYNRIDDVSQWYDSLYARRQRLIEKWLIYLMALFDRLNRAETQHICDRFALRRGDRLRLVSSKRDAPRAIKVLTSQRSIRPRLVYRVLAPLSYEVILFMMAKAASRSFDSRVGSFLKEYNGTRLAIRGNDIKRLGLRPGPGFRRILKEILYTKIDGFLKTKKDELDYARELIARRKI